MRYTYLLVALATLLLSGCFSPTVTENVTLPDQVIPVEVVASIDYEYDGVVDQVDIYTYTGEGNVGTILYDGLELLTFVFDGDKLIYEYLDVHNDGVVERVESYEYNLDGDLTTKNIDENNDGTLEEATYYDTVGGNIINEYQDIGVDGVYDAHHIYTYTNGKLSAIETDVLYNGVIDYKKTYEYTATTTTVFYDDYADGTIEEYTEYVYSDDLLVRVNEYYGDGSLNVYYTYIYDSNGYPVEYYEHESDGTITLSITYENTY